MLGTAVGDAIGLPREAMERGRAERMFGGRPFDHDLVLGRGLCSDDTEHTVMVGQALLASGGSVGAFQRDLARRMRWWLVRLPAGIGLGTLRALLRLWLGVPPSRSGVESAGNGAAMRSALIGVVSESDPQARELAVASSVITHRDPRAIQGARIVALAARRAMRGFVDGEALLDELMDDAHDEDLRAALSLARDALRRPAPVPWFLLGLGLGSGVTGFVNHTVPAALLCWLANRGSFRDAVEEAVALGGDTDTVAAIAGALAGAELGAEAIPRDWVAGIVEWPCTVEWMRGLADELAVGLGRRADPPGLPVPALIARNIGFAALVLAHGLRRSLPPY